MVNEYLVSYLYRFIICCFLSLNANVIDFHFTDEEISLLHMKVDLIVTLGGDGTVLWVSASNHMLYTLMSDDMSSILFSIFVY